MRRTEERTIDGIPFEIGQLPATRALLVFNKLLAAIGPVGEKLFEGIQLTGDKKVGLLDLGLGKLSGAIGAICAQLPPAEFEKLVKELLVCTRAQVGEGFADLSKPGQIDVVFQGQLSTLFKVLAASIEVNFGDFRSAFAAYLGAAGKATEKSSNGSAPTSSSSGPSGG